jgi:hypothetical protein
VERTVLGVQPAKTELRPSAFDRPAQPIAPAQPTAPGRVPATPAPAGAPGAPQELAPFVPPAVRRGGLATRSWIPVALSFGTALVTAVALVVYFAAR